MTTVAQVGDWLTLSVGILIGVLTPTVMILIARRQRYDLAAGREREEALRRERNGHDAKVARREKWHAEHEEIRKLLKLGEDIVYQVRNFGPFTAAGLSALGVGTFKMNAEQLAERGVEQLRDPLLRLATLIDELTQAAVPEETVVTAASQGPIPEHRLAIFQDRGARELADQISCAWLVLRAEWGS